MPIALAAERRANQQAVPFPESFADLNCAQPLKEALKLDGLSQLMEVQQLAWSPLRHSHKDVALVAEAGSGKTIAYLLPLIDQMLEPCNAEVKSTGPYEVQQVHVIVPTHELATQVLGVARTLTALTSLAVVAADESARPIRPTRGGALKRKQAPDKINKQTGSKQVADNAHQPSVTSIPQVIVGTASASAPLIRSAAKRGVRMAIVFDECDFLLAGIRLTGGKAAASPAGSILDTVRPSSKKSAGPGSQGARLVFASATVPGQGKKSLGAFLDARFPTMEWVRTSGAHRPITRLASEFEFVESSSEREAKLIEVVEGRTGRTLVFANSASRAEDALKALARAGVDATAFHTGLPLDARERALAAFKQHSRGVLVCSGLASRGIDLPGVAMVVEYQVAPNIVEYMHRVGRTARAGREGHAMSLVSMESKNEAALVEEVRRCVKSGWKYL
eukprot:CAMPEP_0115827748 /NCGR_PEP_ID=MMETSP0287-20121206/207_1 /TAXON_ID=412157 /ORGANISM="Chrysochromulina rotalis, Strain UIO044" /LENGTH=448 /DNA_ID=CAMNT_0003280921 /DNA_START=44 /DNA_END=1390 /DNA_ORIENTATION=+